MRRAALTSPRRYSPAVQRYLEAALSENTLRAYRNDLKHFFAWGGTLPTTPECLAEYLAQHAKVLACSTLGRRLVAIDREHRKQGMHSPTDSDLVRATLQGIRRIQGCAVKQAAPLSKDKLLKMLRGINGLRGLRDRALLLIGFAAALRRSELVGLTCEDVVFAKDGLIIRLRKSKTDQEGKGREVYIPNVRGQDSPRRALQKWLDESHIRDGVIFRQISRADHILPEPLSGQSIALIIKRRAKDAGFDPDVFSGHSLRAGFVTDAAGYGVPSHRIREQTGHKSDAMLQRYIRQTQMFSNSPLLKIWCHGDPLTSTSKK